MASSLSFTDSNSGFQLGIIHGQVNTAFHFPPDDLLDRLPFATDAPFNAYTNLHEPTCLPSTRVDLLEEIYNWADRLDERWIFWLNGLSGTGKSTIARTVARRFYERKRLAASFFFSKGGGEVGHAGLFVTSIAMQLAHNVPESHQYIHNAIMEHSDITSQSIRDQWRHLILRPLSKLREPSSYVLVIDALDECDNENVIQLIVQLLAEVRLLEKVRLRIFLTSTPEVSVRHGFYQLPEREHQDFILHNILPRTINFDIRLFLEHHLRLVANDDWPGAEDIERLVQSAGGLFIWAATACRFICEDRLFAPERLELILYSNKATAATPQSCLDGIYTTVLNHLIRTDVTDNKREKQYRMLRYILGSLVTLSSPLSILSLERLLFVANKEINQTLHGLRAVLNIPLMNNQPLRIHHPSFRDFLLDVRRNSNVEFWVDDKQAHAALADNCIRLMSTLLRQDICRLGTPGTLIADVQKNHLENYFPLELKYACSHWVQHLEQRQHYINDGDSTDTFLQKHFLHWLEAMSLMGETKKCTYMIDKLRGLAKRSNSPLSRFLKDGSRFLLRFRQILEDAPLQIYATGLIFAPETSIIRKVFADEMLGGIQMLSKREIDWGVNPSVIEDHSGKVRAVSFSPDGRLVASASEDKTVRVWKAATGSFHSVLYGHSDDINLVVFSSDSTRLASASYDRTVKVWDVSNRVCLQTLDIGKVLNHISFDIPGSNLHTNIGTIELSIPPGSSLLPSNSNPQGSQYQGLALSEDGVWITHNSKNLVYLPWDYRPSCSAVSGKTIGVGVGSGKVWICSIQLDQSQKGRDIEEMNVPALEGKDTTVGPLQIIGGAARSNSPIENSQKDPSHQKLASIQAEVTGLQFESDETSTYGGTTATNDESIFTGQTLLQRSVLKASNEELMTSTPIPELARYDDDIRSLVSEEEGNPSHLSISKNERHSEIENAIIGLLATNSMLAPVYEKSLELMPKERFANNFRRLLKGFHEDLRRFGGTLVTQELAAILRPKEARARIARKIIDKHISHQNSLNERDLLGVHGLDKTNLSYLEAWLSKGNFPPPPVEDPQRQNNEILANEEETSNHESEFEDEEQDENNHLRRIDIAKFPRLDLAMQALVEGEPFQDMLIRMKEFLLPKGLLKDILSIPRESITYDSNGGHNILNTIQGLVEDLTALEWDWWPLPSRMHPLNEGETRVYWRCICGTLRWRTLKPAQKDILEDILKEPPKVFRRPLLCTSLCSPAVQTSAQSRPALVPEAQPRGVSISLSRITTPAAVYSPRINSSATSQLSASPALAQNSSGASSAPDNGPSTQNSYQQRKPLWFIFKIEGPRSGRMWDQFGDEGLVTDRMFQHMLRRRHNRLRGRLRLWFSYWRLSYWEFVKLQRTRPGRLVDRGIDLPIALDYDYSPRPPTITPEDPWISKHEFEEIVKSCITPCWLEFFPTVLGFHDCACPEEDAKRLVGALPKRKSEFMIDDSSDREDYVWGIHARYVVSALYVFWIHVGILAITVGLWVWWQRKHPNDLQGASVPVTVAGICISTFWASTGILKGLR